MALENAQSPYPEIIPTHVAIIMDGNGRWGKQHALIRSAGHRAGFKNFVKITEESVKAGVKYLTVYAFSSENWGRSDDEVGALMKIMNDAVIDYVPTLIKNGVKLKVIGDINRFDEKTKNALLDAEKKTAGGEKMVLCTALSYGGRDEIVKAAKEIADAGEEFTAENMSAHMYTGGIPDPDFIIRTGGELRVSNFLLWQSAYAEYYFTPILWPDFGPEEYCRALFEFGKRKRRYGKEK